MTETDSIIKRAAKAVRKTDNTEGRALRKASIDTAQDALLRSAPWKFASRKIVVRALLVKALEE